MSDARSPVEAYLDGLRRVVNAALERVFETSIAGRSPSLIVAGPAPALIIDAMNYALLGGGKRLRPCLTLAAADSCASGVGLAPDRARALALPAACAIEMVHTYSLVHDDLPAMDDDDLRRGRPTTHVLYGDGIAILAGDGLLTAAFELIATGDHVPANERVRQTAILARAAGPAGMVGGQAIDLAAAGRALRVPAAPQDADALEDMHARKTGALMRAAATLGAVATGANDDTVAAIDDYGRELGLAFQIIDDVLDVEASSETLGKTAGKDAAAGKPTYPARYGVDRSRELAQQCVDRARSVLDAAGLAGELGAIADWTIRRQN